MIFLKLQLGTAQNILDHQTFVFIRMNDQPHTKQVNGQMVSVCFQLMLRMKSSTSKHWRDLQITPCTKMTLRCPGIFSNLLV